MHTLFYYSVQGKKSDCKTGHSVCGDSNSKWHDKFPMGFPFDRKAKKGTKNLLQFLTPNMKTQQILIKFNNAIE